MQPKRHSHHAGSGTDLEAGARLIPFLSTLPGHPTQAPTGWQPPPLGRQGQLDKAAGRALGRWHCPARAGSSPGPVPGTSSSPPPCHRVGRGCLSQPHPQAWPWEGQVLSWAASSLPLRSLLCCQARCHLAGAQGSGQRWHLPHPWVLAAQGCARRPLCGSRHARSSAAPR